MPIPIGAAMLGGAGLNFLGGMMQKQPEGPAPTYSIPGIMQQGRLIRDMVNSSRRGDGDFGFAPAAQAGNATLQQMLRDRGMAGNTGEGAGGSLFAQMLSQAMGQDAAGRRQFGLQAAQAQPWVFNYQNKGNSPLGSNWNPQKPNTSGRGLYGSMANMILE